MDWSECTAIEQDAQRVSGAWVFRGTRIPVAALFQNLADGVSLGEFTEIFPGVTAEQVRLVLEHAAQISQGSPLPELRAAAEKAGQRPA